VVTARAETRLTGGSLKLRYQLAYDRAQLTVTIGRLCFSSDDGIVVVVVVVKESTNAIDIRMATSTLIV